LPKSPGFRYNENHPILFIRLNMFAIGIDSGTQGAKVLIVDIRTGKVHGRGSAPHAMIPGLKPGENEQDPASWIVALEAALSAALKAAGIDAARIVSAGVSGQQHGFVPLDAEGKAIRPAKLWNDTSTIEETREIVDKLGGRGSVIEKLGLDLAVGYTASKILWLKKHEPERFKRLATILLPHNYLNYHLTGKLQMEHGDASGTGLMDVRRREWRAEAIEAVDPGLAEKLPPLRHPSEPVGAIQESFAAKFGLRKVLVSSGGGDNMMAAIGTGIVTPGVCLLSLGTSGTCSCFSDRPVVDPAGEIAAFCDGTGGWLPLFCTLNMTGATEAIKNLLRLDHATLELLASQAPAGSYGLVFLPFLDGERVPALPQASGVFFGLDRRNFKAAPMARAVMEGTILNIGRGFSRMKELGLEPTEIRAAGGGAKNRLWLRIAADVLQKPLVTPREREAAAYGAAIQSIWAFLQANGEGPSMAELCQKMVKIEGSSVEPDPGHFGVFEALQARFQSLWTTLKPEFREHRNFRNRS